MHPKVIVGVVLAPLQEARVVIVVTVVVIIIIIIVLGPTPEVEETNDTE
jgi:hypothetical protein